MSRLFVFGLVAVLLSACGEDAPETPENATPAKKTYAHPGMLDVSAAQETAPDSFKVKFETTKGDFVVEATREWAPRGAARFYNLVNIGYFDGVKFFRVVANFMAQFGLHPDPAVNAVWADSQIEDDPVKKTNRRGYMTFATAGPDTRSVQFFINYKNNTNLDAQGFSPFGKVVEGMDVVDNLYSGYGEEPSRLQGPIKLQGDAALAHGGQR